MNVRWTDEQMLDAIRSVKRDDGTASSKEYERALKASPKGKMPAYTTLVKRFGSWNAAVEKAGLKPAAQVGPTSRKQAAPLPPAQEDEPMRFKLRRMREAQGLSRPALAKRLPEGRGGSLESIVGIETGERELPELATIKAIAQGLRVEPEVFAEFQMQKLRHMLDPREDQGVGYKRALKTLQTVQRLLLDE